MGMLASLARFGPTLRLQILMLEHPQIQISQGKWISAGWIVRRIAQFRMFFPPMDSDPRRQTKFVMGFLRAEHLKILIVPN
jgi:hypothetical protein